MTFTWNIVPRNLQPDEQVRKKIHQEIRKLDRHLQHFSPETVHLQITLERNPQQPLHTVTLTLRLPSDILRSEKSAPDLGQAFDDALEALLHDLDSIKAEPRQRRLPKRKNAGAPGQEPAAAGFAAEPMADGTGPQKLEDVVHDFFQQHYNRLLYHARRHIRHGELTGEFPEGALNPRDIVDEVARQTEARARQKPDRIHWLVWIYHLLHEEIDRQRDLWKEKRAQEVPKEKRVTLPENRDRALHPLEKMVKKVLEPEITKVEDVVPQPGGVPPDRIVEAKELLESLQARIPSWPQSDRDVFELYFVQGFEPEDIAVITGEPLEEVRKHIESVQNRLREEMLHEEAPA